MKFIIFRQLILESSTRNKTTVAFPTKPGYYPYLRYFILMTSCRTETETVSRMVKA